MQTKSSDEAPDKNRTRHQKPCNPGRLSSKEELRLQEREEKEAGEEERERKRDEQRSW